MSVVIDPPVTRPVAELDRRFYAFVIDRAIAWGVDGAVAVAAVQLLIREDRVAVGVAVIVATVLVVSLAFALLLGLRGTSPGRAVAGIRLVRDEGGGPIGVAPALLRQLVLGVAGLPTFGLGLAALAWTVAMDPSGRRRGWHDRLAHSITVDVRPVPVAEPEVEAGPRHVVNLTAMRLVPAPAAPPVAPPVRSPLPPPPPAAPPPPVAAPEPAPVPAGRHAAPPGRQRLGYPLVPEPEPAPEPRVGTPHSTAERTIARSGGDATGPARWRVRFDSGESFLVEGLALVGRRPEPRAGEPVRHLVPLRSEDMSLSKTHAQFQVAADGVLVVMDRGSTNGSVLVRQGVPRELPAGRPTTLVDGDRVRFGDREMAVVRES